jgi:hypothetical protein
MKPLILILLAGTYLSAQNPSLADFAREERARREVANKERKVYTTEDIRTTAPGEAPANPAPAAAPSVVDSSQNPAAAPAPAEATAATTPAPDPLKQWLEDTEKLREKIRELIDREATTQLDINKFTNDVYAPDTNETARTRSQAQLASSQQSLGEVREALAKNRLELQQREADGPPKKQP